MADQLNEDKKLVERIDVFGKNLKPGEINAVEGWKRQLEAGRVLTGPQRKFAEDIEARRVD